MICVRCVHRLDVMCFSSAELSPVGYIISCVFMVCLIKEFMRYSCIHDNHGTAEQRDDQTDGTSW